ncbi:MAG: hypothetical protein ABIO70_06330 [Pseudomonadota bacterium]
MRRLLRLLLAALVLLALHQAAGCWAHRLYEGSASPALADAVADWALTDGPGTVGSPGGPLFDGEWAFGACVMAVAGLGQVALEHPDLQESYLPAMDRCVAWLVTPEARAFGTRMWGYDGLDGQGLARGEHAYLGYLGVALGVRRLLQPDSPWADLHDRLAVDARTGLAHGVAAFQTYPGQTYPPDLATVAATVALHDRATGQTADPALDRWLATYRREAVDPATGMLIQRLSPTSGRPADLPRGSGTAFASYFLVYADPGLSGELYAALPEVHTLGLGAVREYARGTRGPADIDSGPVILGLGISATGFALAGARAHGDRATYRRILRTACICGLPIPLHGGRWFVTGGGIGNAILLAMLTAPRG